MRLRHRSLALTILVALGWAVTAEADDPGRYALSASRDGFVRLDTATGAVSHCRPQNGIWRCEPMTADDGGLRARVDALTSEVARLTATVAALDARLAALAPVSAASPVTPPAPPSANAPAPANPNFVHQAVARLFDLVRTIKHGRDKPMPAAT